MNQEEIITYWQESADQSVRSAEELFKVGQYHHSLFFWHLALEKILKMKIASQDIPVPYTHDLVKLATAGKITLNDEEKSQLDEITTFNLESRYDSYRFQFYKKATKEYTEQWQKTCQDFFRQFGGTI